MKLPIKAVRDFDKDNYLELMLREMYDAENDDEEIWIIRYSSL